MTRRCDIMLYVTLMLQFLSECATQIALPSAELVAPQTEINQIFYEKPLTAENVDDKAKLSEYIRQRNQMIETEQLLFTGGHLKLNEKELQVQQIFMRHKLIELTYGMENQQKHAPALHFFKAKPLIEQSNVFKFLQVMPKGASLHIHRTPAVSTDWIIRNLTYMPGLLKCLKSNGDLILSFRMQPKQHECRTDYYVVAEERKRTFSRIRYDKYLETKFTLYTHLPEFEYITSNRAWERFEAIFDVLGDTMCYEPVFRAFNWQLMQEMYDDNIMYAELRMKFKPLYGPNGTLVATEYEAIELLLTLVDQFKRVHPGFMGLKIIYATYRAADQAKIQNAFEEFKDLHERYPNFIIGFDVMGNEDKGNALHEFLPILQNLPATAKYFFHAGETNLYGTSVDFNLIDAILLNTTRIGHGYAFMKHPMLLKIVNERDIALEISPISNQILNLITDLRNHPGGYFMSNNIPLVITNDDPGFWYAKGLSYDYYYAIMSFAPSNAGLKTLKNLVWNSIKYSAMNGTEKELAYKQLDSDWNIFLDLIISGRVV